MNIRMEDSVDSDEKREAKTVVAKAPASVSISDCDDLAMLTLEKRVLRKTDMVVLPMMCCVFFFQYLDKQSLSYASVYGLIQDLELKGNQFAWTSSIFYVGQLASEFPFIYLMSRFKLSKSVGITIVVWGAVCTCLAAPKTYHGFLAVRFFLGAAEGAVSPAFITITSIWYRKSEHALRVGCWITCNAIAQIVGSLLMYGIGEHNTSSFASWRLMFLICGIFTILCGVAFYFIMPDGPESAWFFSEEEKIAARHRLSEDHDGGDKTSFSMEQLKEAALDFKTYAAFSFGVLVTAPAPVLTASTFSHVLGYTSGETLLHGCPSGAVQICAIWIGIIATFIWPQRRSLIIMFLVAIPLAGCIMLLVLPLKGWPIIIGAWLGSCISSIFSLTMSLNASNIRGNTKRSVVNTAYFIGYCSGCIAFPQLWTTETAPRYTAGLVVSVVDWAILILLMGCYWLHGWSENKRRDQLESESTVALFEAGADITDKQDLTFRYSL
ncbi:related to permease of the major facilitator superfamily [Rhynchosporium secalis]|uniref:Related to permease of the major facilitator superfamily n=1 Tax=Rhynchosporium secalis TaxID=38038 RepID=A0A1E1MKH7_RHYSE|nr:related to permease of the major facilitator superfamily [Rhynchosporium secalis]